MKSIEFKASVTSDGQLALPPSVSAQLPPGEEVRVVLLWNGADEDWSAMGRQRFEESYSPEDSVYEELLDDAKIR